MLPSIKRQWLVIPALLIAGFCFYYILSYLQRRHSTETIMVVSLAGTAYSAALIFSWLSFGKWAAVIFSVLGLVMMGLPLGSIPYGWFLGYFLWYGIVLGMLHELEKHYLNEQLAEQMLMEKNVEERTRLEQLLVRQRMTFDVLKEKRDTYVSLKSVADEFASSLSLNLLAELIVKKVAQVVSKGDLILLYLVDLDANELSLAVSQSSHPLITARSKRGDLFDHWVFKHRQSLLITDTSSDYRFDISREGSDQSLKSLIAAPLINEGRIIGVVRVSSGKPDCFGTDDLRTLSILAIMGSSALTNAILYQKTVELAISDSLTGLYVQRYFRERFQEEHQRALISNSPFCVLMCDIDHFKECNDQYGHATGDLLLKSVSATLKEHIGDSGILARYGGEEFAAILRNIEKVQAFKLAEELRASVESIRVSMRGMELRTTISIGIAAFPADALDPEELIRLADKALYRAKASGRNTVCSSA